MQKRNLVKSNGDFPQIIINSIPAPELIYETISDRDLLPYASGLKELDNFGVDFIVMVCNTIHLFHGQLQKGIKAPILDLKIELKQFLSRKKIKSAAIFGTPLLIKKGLYRFDKIKYFDLSTLEQRMLCNAISNFNRGFEKEKHAGTVKGLAQIYVNKGAEIIILGCTELALMLEKENLPKIDTIDILVDSTINEFLHLK